MTSLIATLYRRYGTIRIGHCRDMSSPAIDDATRLLEAVTKFIGVLIWPAVTVFILVRFGPALREFVASLGEFSLKSGGFEASAKRKQADAAAALTAAIVSKRKQADAAAALTAAVVSRPQPGATPDTIARDARTALDIVAQVATPRAIQRVGKSVVLWVDDKPENDIHERQALEALGVSFVLALSTDEALENFKRQTFDAIISDMARPPDSQAGYTLLDKLRASGDRTPFIIYAGSSAPEHRTEARGKGALGCTHRADELFDMVISAIGQRHSA